MTPLFRNTVLSAILWNLAPSRKGCSVTSMPFSEQLWPRNCDDSEVPARSWKGASRAPVRSRSWIFPIRSRTGSDCVLSSPCVLPWSYSFLLFVRFRRGHPPDGLQPEELNFIRSLCDALRTLRFPLCGNELFR